jgi:hypothetical protein
MPTIRFILAALALALSQFAGAGEPLHMNGELHALYQADQADRKGDAIDWQLVGPRDLARQLRVRELAEAGALKHSGDYLHAAMVFQHGQTAEHYRQANLWALRAVELDPTNTPARWLACASEDRWLHRTGKPQIWGTQYQKPSPDGSPAWSMEPFDRLAKTDAERVAMGVKTLAESAARLAEMNKKQSGK